ncbi:MAG: GreA/GreB family elongation factor [Verrucomicrobiota bacterium]
MPSRAWLLAGKYKSWWDSTKKKLRDDRQFVVPSKRSEPLELRAEGFDPADSLVEDFRKARDLKAKVKAAETIIKELNLFDEKTETLQTVSEEVGDAGKRGAKLNYTQAVELILVRDDLVSKAKGLNVPEGAATIAKFLQDSDDEKLPELFESLSLNRLRQVLRSFPEAFGEEEWIGRMLGLVNRCNLRTITEMANYISDSGSSDPVIDFFETGLRQRTLSSDALAWVCKERKGMAEVIFDPSISLSVMSSLETDQLNEETAMRSANRLRDLVSDDRDLIPDLISDADINTVRNFSSRLMAAASFDELTRKSLLARVIKLHPEMGDLVAGRKNLKEEVLIVSNESLAKRKEAYDKLVKDEIPQNREDIKIARSYGDLRENFEYKSAKDYQRVLMKRKADWEKDLRIASPTDFADPDTTKVSIGTVVQLESTEGKDALTYTILGAWDSDLDKGIIAYLSERGDTLLEKEVGDTVEFKTGAAGQTESYKIASISSWK